MFTERINYLISIGKVKVYDYLTFKKRKMKPFYYTVEKECKNGVELRWYIIHATVSKLIFAEYYGTEDEVIKIVGFMNSNEFDYIA